MFDKLLIETILRFRRETGTGELNVAVAVKGSPIINDATLEDATYVGMDTIPNVTFRATSGGGSDTGPAINSDEVKSWIESHDLAISKGQGNYEGLSQFRNVFFMLIAKCAVIASDLGVKEGDIVLKHTK